MSMIYRNSRSVCVCVCVCECACVTFALNVKSPITMSDNGQNIW